MKTKSNYRTHIRSEIFKRDDEIYVALSLGTTQVTIRRSAKPDYDFTTGKKPRYLKKYPAVISWSGGNGAEHIEHAQAFGQMIIWATRIAQTMTRSHNPAMLSVEKLLSSADENSLRVVSDTGDGLIHLPMPEKR